MKTPLICSALLSTLLLSCGGSDSNENPTTGSKNKTVIANLSGTSWIKACAPISKTVDGETTILWYANFKIDLDASLKATYRTDFFRPTDSSCDSIMFDTLEISTFEITGKIITEESIEAYGLNETFIYSSNSSKPAPKYTLVYLNSEKLYFGQNSGTNLGETAETRHSSISLDDYFTQVIN